jgi:hypothetical protein
MVVYVLNIIKDNELEDVIEGIDDIKKYLKDKDGDDKMEYNLEGYTMSMTTDVYDDE